MPSVSNKQKKIHYLQEQNKRRQERHLQKPKLLQDTARPTQFDWQKLQHSKEYIKHTHKVYATDQPTILKMNNCCGWTENIKSVSCWQAAVGHKLQHAVEWQIPLV